MRLAYSEDAVADLIRLRGFIAEKDPAAAARAAANLIARIEHLGRFPNLGRSVIQAPEADVVRDAVFGNYVVRYSVHVEAVIILRIWHPYEDRQGGA